MHSTKTGNKSDRFVCVCVKWAIEVGIGEKKKRKKKKKNWYICLYFVWEA